MRSDNVASFIDPRF